MKYSERISEYESMWLLVFFDMPTETKEQRRAYTDFRKRIINDGFTMFQFSIYVRHCQTRDSADVHRQRVRNLIPQWGEIGILMITDKQFGQIELFRGVKRDPPRPTAIQLELF